MKKYSEFELNLIKLRKDNDISAKDIARECNIIFHNSTSVRTDNAINAAIKLKLKCWENKKQLNKEEYIKQELFRLKNEHDDLRRDFKYISKKMSKNSLRIIKLNKELRRL
jgi:hypothetical protein